MKLTLAGLLACVLGNDGICYENKELMTRRLSVRSDCPIHFWLMPFFHKGRQRTKL